MASCALFRPAEKRDPEPSVDAAAAGRFYTILAGDTLWTIAQRHGVAAEELAEVNGIDDPTRLQVGQRIFIPHGRPGGAAVAVDTEGRGDGPRETASTAPTDATHLDARLAWPLEGGILLREYSARSPLPYDGLLLAAPLGTEVLAAAAGEVVYVGDEGTELGNLVIVQHDAGLVTIYGHLETARVPAGARVPRGSVIGTVGESGRAESPQLHFQVRNGRAPEDPLSYLPAP